MTAIGRKRKRSRFTETRIVSILKEVDAGRKVKEICRRHGISDANVESAANQERASAEAQGNAENEARQ